MMLVLVLLLLRPPTTAAAAAAAACLAHHTPSVNTNTSKSYLRSVQVFPDEPALLWGLEVSRPPRRTSLLVPPPPRSCCYDPYLQQALPVLL